MEISAQLRRNDRENERARNLVYAPGEIKVYGGG
jgi:hypothetical protein